MRISFRELKSCAIPDRRTCGLLILLSLVAPQMVIAQAVDVETLLSAKSTTDIISVGDRIFAGTENGGLLVMDRADPVVMQRWVSGSRLSGNQVTQLAWTGRFLWVSTLDNGLTRIDRPESAAPTFRQYLDNVGSRNVTGVTGAMVDGDELVYYAMQEAGVGKITNGVSGLLYSADQDNLLSDDVNDLQMLGDELFVATDLGVSRLKNNIFSDVNEGLTHLVVNDLALDCDGNLLAGGRGGVYRWDAAQENWTFLGGIGSWVVSVTCRQDGTLWALGINSSNNGVLAYRDGSSWQDVAVPYLKTGTIYGDESLWIGGRVLPNGMAAGTGRAFVSRYLDTAVFENFESNFSLVRNAEGIAFGNDGSAWIGSWLADAISTRDTEGNWRHIYEVASDENGNNGLFNQGANVLCMAGDAAGYMWAGQFSSGALRIDPEDLTTDHLTASNSGLDGQLLLNIVAHPDGPVFFLHDLDGGMVDVLTDPENWDQSASWVNLPQTDDALGSELKVWEALVERRDLIWFAVEGRGLVRWDVNGAGAGPDDELTWDDASDDLWYEPISAFEDTNGFEVSDPRRVRGMSLAPDGSIWAGGDELVRFVLDRATGAAIAVEHWSEKTASFENGLISGSVLDVGVDINGDLWAATAAGVNRLRWRDGRPGFDPWIDLRNYLLFPDFRDLYSPSIVAELPGLTYRRLEVDREGKRVLLASDLGAVMFHVAEGHDTGGTSESSIDQLYLYPNPWSPDQGDGQLRLGGFVDGDSGDEPASVEILTLEGQPVYRDRSVEADRAFWSGHNRPGEEVATGLYLVRIVWNGATITRTLAVVR